MKNQNPPARRAYTLTSVPSLSGRTSVSDTIRLTLGEPPEALSWHPRVVQRHIQKLIDVTSIWLSLTTSYCENETCCPLKPNDIGLEAWVGLEPCQYGNSSNGIEILEALLQVREIYSRIGRRFRRRISCQQRFDIKLIELRRVGHGRLLASRQVFPFCSNLQDLR